MRLKFYIRLLAGNVVIDTDDVMPGQVNSLFLYIHGMGYLLEREVYKVEIV